MIVFNLHIKVFADDIFNYTKVFLMLIPTYILQDRIMRVYGLLLQFQLKYND